MALDASKEAVDFALRWTNAFPKPGPNQGVRADAALAAFRALVPLATRIGALTVGATKRGWVSRTFGPAVGYLTGPAVTQKDVDEAKTVLAAVNTVLPPLGQTALKQPLLDALKAAGQWTLMVGTDLNTDPAILAPAADAWGAVEDSVADLTEVAVRAATEPWLLRAGLQEVSSRIDMGTMLLYAALGLGGLFIAVKVISKGGI